MANERLIVAGGGLGGLALAIAGGRAGIPVTVLERAAEFSEIGAGIQLGANGLAALRLIGVADAVIASAFAPGALRMRDAVDGHELLRIPLGAPFAERFGEPYVVTYRADLHRALLDAALAQPNVTLRSHCKVVDAQETASGVAVTTAEGETIAGTALVGCDGLWSPMRAALIGDGPPRVSGHIAYRAVLPVERVPAELLHDDVMLWAGPKLHLVTYKLRRGTIFNLVAVFHSDRYTEGWDAAGDPTELYERFAGMQPEVLRLLDLIETWRMWVLCDREPTRGWSRGRMTLLGDAAHPMLQYLAQGASMSFEDAVALVRSVVAHGGLHGDVAAAFAAYENERAVRTARVQLTARFYGEFYHAGGLTREVRNLLAAGSDPARAYAPVEWLYGGTWGTNSP